MLASVRRIPFTVTSVDTARSFVEPQLGTGHVQPAKAGRWKVTSLGRPDAVSGGSFAARTNLVPEVMGGVLIPVAEALIQKLKGSRVSERSMFVNQGIGTSSRQVNAP